MSQGFNRGERRHAFKSGSISESSRSSIWDNVISQGQVERVFLLCPEVFTVFGAPEPPEVSHPEFLFVRLDGDFFEGVRGGYERFSVHSVLQFLFSSSPSQSIGSLISNIVFFLGSERVEFSQRICIGRQVVAIVNDNLYIHDALCMQRRPSPPEQIINLFLGQIRFFQNLCCPFVLFCRSVEFHFIWVYRLRPLP